MWNFLVTYAYQKSSVYAVFRLPVIKYIIKYIIKLSIKGNTDRWIVWLLISVFLSPVGISWLLIEKNSMTYAYQKARNYTVPRAP